MRQQQMYRSGAILALAAMSVLLVWAAVFYKQRMLLCDDSYAFFRIVNRQQLQIQQYRYGSFITQIFALIAAKLHLSLKPALVLYSVGFNLFYLAIAFILFRLNEYKLVILMSFYYLLMTSDSFYWAFDEVYAAVAWMFLFYGLLLSSANKKKSLVSAIIIAVLLGGLALITHPLVILPLIYLWGFYYINKEDRPCSTTKYMQLSIVVLLLVIGRIIISKYFSGYDSNLVDKLVISKEKFLQVGKSDFVFALKRNVEYNFWILPILFVIGFTTMLMQRRYLLALWTVAFCFGFVAVVCFVFEGYLGFYTEAELMPVVIPATTPFVFLVLPRMKKTIAIGVLLFIFANRLYHIHQSSYAFTSRYHFVNDVLYRMQQKNISKLALIKNDKNADPRLMLDWGLPTETIIASALMGQNPQRQFLIRNSYQLWDSLPSNKTTLMGCFENWPYDKINHGYFNPDTCSYVIMPVDSFIAPYKGN
jgi:hypothetical protein